MLVKPDSPEDVLLLLLRRTIRALFSVRSVLASLGFSALSVIFFRSLNGAMGDGAAEDADAAGCGVRGAGLTCVAALVGAGLFAPFDEPGVAWARYVAISESFRMLESCVQHVRCVHKVAQRGARTVTCSTAISPMSIAASTESSLSSSAS